MHFFIVARSASNTFCTWHLEIGMLLKDALAACRHADLIGVGEDIHGERLSWDVRLRLVRDAVRAGYAVTILCENLDFYVAGLSKKTIQFVDEPDDGFYPNMIPWSNDRETHLAPTKALAYLAEGRVYGIDVQALDFEHLRGRRIVRSVLERVRARWQAASESERGKIRNKLNAEILLHFMDQARASAKQRKTKAKVFYFAHNAHVAMNSHECRSSPIGYLTDGHWIAEGCARRGIQYLSVGTYTPITSAKHGLLKIELRNTRWREQQRRIQKLLEREPASSRGMTVMSGRLGLLGRSDRTSVDDMGMGSFQVRDFDVVIVAAQQPVH